MHTGSLFNATASLSIPPLLMTQNSIETSTTFRSTSGLAGREGETDEIDVDCSSYCKSRHTVKRLFALQRQPARLPLKEAGRT
jgi:hypothetical protein